MRAASAPILLLSVALTGCWKDEYAVLPANIVEFAPEAGPVEPGWLVEPILIPGLLCPDGVTARFHVVYPEAAIGGGPLPAATIYPTGAFDFVFAADPAAPFDGAHFAEPTRLTSEWAVRQTFVTLGMYPNQDALETQSGALPLALVEQGIVLLIPGNCWGDLWHNAPGLADNDYEQDFFFRNGRVGADWGHRLLADPTFGALFGIELPVAIDPAQTYAVGLGSGGRAVAEMLQITNRDGTRTFSPAGVLVDSSYDDLRFVYEDPTLYGNTVAGLDRIHPDGVSGTFSGSMFAIDAWPERTGYLFSEAHPTIPQPTFAASAARMQREGGWLYVGDTPTTSLLNDSANLELARQAVQFLLTGAQPPAGPGEIPSAE